MFLILEGAFSSEKIWTQAQSTSHSIFILKSSLTCFCTNVRLDSYSKTENQMAAGLCWIFKRLMWCYCHWSGICVGFGGFSILISNSYKHMTGWTEKDKSCFIRLNGNSVICCLWCLSRPTFLNIYKIWSQNTLVFFMFLWTTKWF